MFCWPPSRRCLANARSARPRARSEIGTRGIKTALHRNQQPNNRRKSNYRKHQRAACKPNRKRCYQGNGQYSITALADATGSISERYAYFAYGKLTVTDGSGTALSGSGYGNRYTYTGREWDEGLGLYHYRARMYDPVAGRFCSRDPIAFRGSKWNLYEYVGGQPTFSVDPLGLQKPTSCEGRLDEYGSGDTCTITCHCPDRVPPVWQSVSNWDKDTRFGGNRAACTLAAEFYEDMDICDEEDDDDDDDDKWPEDRVTPVRPHWMDPPGLQPTYDEFFIVAFAQQCAKGGVRIIYRWFTRPKPTAPKPKTLPFPNTTPQPKPASTPAA